MRTDAEIEFDEDIFSELLDSEALAFENLTSEDLESEDLSSEFLASDLGSDSITPEHLQHSSAQPQQLSLRENSPMPLAEANELSQAISQPGTNPETPAAQIAGEASKAVVKLKDPFDGNRPIEPGENNSPIDDLPNSHTSNEPSRKIALDDDLAKSLISDFSNLAEDEAEPGEDIFVVNEDETAEDETAPEKGIFAASVDETESEVGFDAYGSDEYDAGEYSFNEFISSEFITDESPTDEDETAEDKTSKEKHYQLEPVAADAPHEAVALVDEREVQKQREQWQQQTKGNPWFFAGAIGFFIIGLLGFVLTRPCSFGSCPRIETARAEGEKALSDLSLEANLKAVTAAKQQLNRSVRSLQPIPFWSPHYAEANAVLPEFEGQLTALDRVSAAQAQAYEAALASQNPPHSSAKWEDIAQQWRGAIATLENVPTDNQVRQLADRKLTEYRANLSTIKVRIDAESQAEASLLAAQKAATLATATANQASSLAAWESALQNWESAVQQIDQIPQGTLAYKEAQGLQAEYRQQMELVRDRTLKERNASRNLSKAQQLASDAKRVASENQWTVAVQTWTAAVKQVQDVALGTAAYTTAQPLVGLYQQSLAKADSNRQVSLRFQPVEPSFYAACGATAAQRCTYSVRNGNVRLNLLKDYDRAINQSITPPDQRRAITIDSGVVTQSNQLLKEITLLSTQGNFPVELYNAKGEFLARYRPDLNGFVKDQKTEI